MNRIAIFAFGNGTNAANLIDYFSDHHSIEVSLIICNRAKAGVLDVAKTKGIPIEVVPSKNWKEGKTPLISLEKNQIDWIVLAGFLLKVPDYVLKAYPKRIINIHPALLPNFGGKGMYGNYVHQAVLDSGIDETGITIHLVNENYDEGEIIFQAKTSVEEADDVDSLSRKVHQLEYKYFPKQIERFVHSNSVPKA